MITVITLSYNCLNELKKTASSVLNQQNVSFEYIIVDGKSTDGTDEYLASLTSAPNIKLKINSERDKGVYDAMNKGINMSTADYIIFMNSGDYFAANNVLANIQPYINKGADVVYGDTLMRYGGECPRTLIVI